MKQNLKHIVLLLLATFALNINISAQSDCWPNFRGNASLTGVSYASLPDKPTMLWNFKTNDAIKAAPVVCDGTIVVGSVDGNIYGISLEGKLKWKINTENGIEAPALIVDNTAYIGDLDGIVHAIELHTGKVLWTYTTEGQIMGAPNYYEKGSKKILIIGSYDYYLHGIDATTGKGLWKFESDNFINGAAAIYEGNAIFGGCDGLLRKVRLTDGQEISSQEVATYVAGSPAIEKGRAFVGDYDGQFTCLDINSSKTVWSYIDTENQQAIIGSPALSAKDVFIGSRDKYLYSFKKSNGDLNWRVNTRGRVDASPVLVGKKILVATMRGDLLILNSSDGKTEWTYEIGTPIISNPAVIDGYIIAAGQDGRVYCFGEK